MFRLNRPLGPAHTWNTPDAATAIYTHAVSADGSLLAFTNSNGLTLVELPQYTIRLTRPELTPVGNLAFSSSGDTLAYWTFTDRNEGGLVDLAGGAVTPLPNLPAGTLTFSPDLSLIVAWSIDAPLIELVRSVDGTPVARVSRPTDVIRTVQISPDNTYLAIAGAEGVWIINLVGNTAPRQIDDQQLFTLAFSPDGDQLAFADTRLHVVNVSDGTLIFQSESAHGRWNAVAAVRQGLAFSPDGRWLVVGSGEAPREPMAPLALTRPNVPFELYRTADWQRVQRYAGTPREIQHFQFTLEHIVTVRENEAQFWALPD